MIAEKRKLLFSFSLFLFYQVSHWVSNGRPNMLSQEGPSCQFRVVKI